jgi:hypothetical protein
MNISSYLGRQMFLRNVTSAWGDIKKILMTFLSVCFLRACALNVRGQGSQWIGQPANALTDKMGMPDRTITSPAGTMVYVYGSRNLHGDELCSASYFIKNENVVGYVERGVAINCDEVAGDTK